VTSSWFIIPQLFTWSFTASVGSDNQENHKHIHTHASYRATWHSNPVLYSHRWPSNSSWTFDKRDY